MALEIIKNEYIEIEKCTKCGDFGVENSHICHPLVLYNKQIKKDMAFAVGIDKKFTRETLVETIRKIYQEQIVFAEKKIEGLFSEYDELFRKGVSFKERSEKIDLTQVEWLRKHIEKLKSDSRNFKIIPFSAWIRYDDYERMKRDGFYNFIKFWFSLTHHV